MSLLRVEVISECNNRTSGARAFPGQFVHVSPEEYERLLAARCIKPIETACAAPLETAVAAHGRRPRHK